MVFIWTLEPPPPPSTTNMVRRGNCDQAVWLYCLLYHRERICFHQLLAATGGGEKSPDLLLCTRPRPFQSTRQDFNHLHTSSKLSPSTPHGLRPPSSTCTNSWSSPPPHTKAKGTHTPLLPFWAWWPRCAASGLSVNIWRPPRPSHWSQDQAWLYFSSWIFLAVEKTALESSAFSAWGWGHVVLACLLGCL